MGHWCLIRCKALSNSVGSAKSCRCPFTRTAPQNARCTPFHDEELAHAPAPTQLKEPGGVSSRCSWPLRGSGGVEVIFRCAGFWAVSIRPGFCGSSESLVVILRCAGFWAAAHDTSTKTARVAATDAARARREGVRPSIREPPRKWGRDGASALRWTHLTVSETPARAFDGPCRIPRGCRTPSAAR